MTMIHGYMYSMSHNKLLIQLVKYTILKNYRLLDLTQINDINVGPLIIPLDS